MIKMTTKLAEVCGIHAGDGYFRQRYRNKGEIDISGHIEEKDYYDNHIVPLFREVFNIELNARKFSRGTYGFVIYHKKVRDIFEDLGIPSGKKSFRITVPKAVLDSKNKKIYAAFLRGFFDTDGNFGCRHGYGKYSLFKRTKNYYPLLRMTTISSRLAIEMKEMLEFLGINCSIYHYINKVLNEQDKYFIYFSGNKKIESWFSLVGSKNPVKLTRYMIWKRFGYCPNHTTLVQRERVLSGKLDIDSIGGR